MTENFIHGCAWVQPESHVPGCVGIGPGVEVRLGEDNEILFRSKALMKGYYKEPATGWTSRCCWPVCRKPRKRWIVQSWPGN